MQFFVLAHGALGIWDEVIFIGVGVLFLIFMVISWVRSRALPPDIPNTPHPDTAGHDEAHFRLD
ncbi:MAG: hypothetical protein MUE54_04925 [Anaerolineae bacterium]|jgi:hypothetical protein|nr:hypothetical protein [Anaerolineae bacterium]